MESEDNTKRGWKESCRMFEEEDHNSLQSCSTISSNNQKVPIRVLGTIQTTIKEEEHFSHCRIEILSDIRQKRYEGIHALRNSVTTLTNNSKFKH